MKLKHLDSDVDFIVTPAAFLGVFDIYDREETLGCYLDQFNPNDPKQLEKLLEERFFNDKRILRYTVNHKIEMMTVLIKALNNKNFDFAPLLVSDPDNSFDTFTLPHSWEFNRPRFYFEEIYRLALKNWGYDLIEAGFNMSIEENTLLNI